MSTDRCPDRWNHAAMYLESETRIRRVANDIEPPATPGVCSYCEKPYPAPPPHMIQPVVIVQTGATS
jgi:hypothetical protein